MWYSLERAALEDSGLARILDIANHFYPHMLMEDVRNRVFPYRSSRRNRDIGIKIIPNDQHVENFIASALGRRGDLADAVFDFGRRCSANIIVFGEDSYEIVYGDASPDMKTRRFELERLPPRSLHHSPSRAIQLVPRRIARELGVPRSITIDQERLVVFQPSGGARQELPRVMERLAAIRGISGMDFVIENLQPGAKRVPYDVATASRAEDLAVAAAARKIGWSGRAIYLFGETRVVEHYWWYRELEFERFLIQLRNELITTLNDALRRIGAVCGFDAQLELVGLPSIEDVKEAQGHLLSGDRSLAEINAAFRG